MKKAFIKYFFSTVVFLGSLIQLYANISSDFSSPFQEEKEVCYANPETFKSEILPLSSKTRFDFEKIIPETVEIEESEISNESQKNNPKSYNDSLFTVFFYDYYLRTSSELDEIYLACNKSKKSNSQKIYIQFEVFRI
jgi:hypothetical protein